MIEYTIEKGIPISNIHKGSVGLSSTLRAMDVGDSVLVPVITEMQWPSFRGYVCGSCSSVKKTTGFSFVTRKVEGGIRVWRFS